MKKAWSSMDVYLVAWIYLTTDIYPELKYYHGKVSFHFPLTDSLIKSINDFNSGKTIKANKFTLIIKNLKSQIFQLKSQKNA